MMGRSVVHELDALDLAAFWPVGGQSSLAPVLYTTGWQSISEELRGGATRGRGKMDEDALYFEPRASEEFLAAAKTRRPRAREAHLTMAQRYQDLAGLDALR